MKFGLIPTALGEAASPKSFTSSASSSSSRSPSRPSSRKSSCPNNNNNHINRHDNPANINNNMSTTTSATAGPAPPPAAVTSSAPTLNSSSDFNQWLHAMKMVARLPGGTPPEFRRKVRIRANCRRRAKSHFSILFSFNEN